METRWKCEVCCKEGSEGDACACAPGVSPIKGFPTFTIPISAWYPEPKLADGVVTAATEKARHRAASAIVAEIRASRGQRPVTMPDVPIVTVTPEMIAAAANREAAPGDCCYVDIYRAMHAAAPVELVSEAEEKVATLRLSLQVSEEKYDLLCQENTRLHDELKSRTDERDAALTIRFERVTTLLRERDELRLELSRLHDLLAQRPAPVPDTPKCQHDWTRVESGDRRMGGR